MGITPRTYGRNVGLALCLTVLVAACTTVEPARVAAFGDAVDKVKLQFDTTFTGINHTVTEDEVERAITRPTLTEDDVGIILSLDDIAKWDNAMGAIDAYVANLTLLLSPDRANEFGAAATNLGTKVSQLGANVPAGVATAFAELGRLLIEAKAESDALQAARKADPAMQKVFAAMAAAIGETQQKGLRSTVREHWIMRMAVQKAAFARANGNAGARRPIVVAFIDLRDKRDSQDLQLASLRQSLLNLGFAHGALARGANADLTTAVGMIQQELAATRVLFDQFQALPPKPKSK